MVKRAAIVLAGGESRRFQRDKALAELFGKPLLVHAIENVRKVVDEVIVVLNKEVRVHGYFDILRKYSIKEVEFCVDEKFAGIRGPFPAIVTGMKHTGASHCMVLPCDFPCIKPVLIDYLIKRINNSKIAVPIWPNGKIEPLMLSCDRKEVAQIGKLLCNLKRWRPTDLLRGASRVTYVSIANDLKNLDPKLESFVNINYERNLIKFPYRSIHSGSIKETFCLNVRSPSSFTLEKLALASELYHKGRIPEALELFTFISQNFEEEHINFWSGIAREKKGECFFDLRDLCLDTTKKETYNKEGSASFERAAQNYRSESRFYEKHGIRFLVKHARMDEERCRRRRVSAISK